jgi:hypothetical protein
MKLQSITEGVLDTVGHAALDAVGFIPGFGEPADLANALWYAKKGDYFSAVLSLVSLVPEIGDVIGKGTKYLGKSNKIVAGLLAKHGSAIGKAWPKIKSMIQRTKAWRPFIRHLDDIIAGIISGKYSQPIDQRIGAPAIS